MDAESMMPILRPLKMTSTRYDYCIHNALVRNGLKRERLLILD